MGAQGSKYELSREDKANILKEYHASSGISNTTHKAGWNERELEYLLIVFATRCHELGEIRAKASHKKKDSSKILPGLRGLLLQKEEAMKYVVVFNQSFNNYPSLSDRFWSVIQQSNENQNTCSFLDYTSLMYKVVRGSYEDRCAVAFNLFDSERSGYISEASVKETILDISEFMCNVARGVIDISEFAELKMKRAEKLFEACFEGKMNLQQFTKVAVYHQKLVGCCEILDMVFGRVIRKMEKHLKKDLVFGRYLQETALGNAKDITGEMPFVPEVIASSIQYLRKYKALGTPELFRKSVSQSLIEDLKKELNNGLTLRTYLQRFRNPQENEFMLLACLIKHYCSSLAEPVFTVEVTKQIIVAQESRNTLAEEKLVLFQRYFQLLPTTNRYFLASLLPFLKDVADAQVTACANGCMNADNLGIVFAPSMLYDPEDPRFGVTSATKVFSTLIVNSHLFPAEKEIPFSPRRLDPEPIRRMRPRNKSEPPTPPPRRKMLPTPQRTSIENLQHIQPHVRSGATHQQNPKPPPRGSVNFL